MPLSITLVGNERNPLLDTYRRHSDPALRLRAHIILLLADGYPWAVITGLLYCSSRTIGRWQTRFRHGRLPALLGKMPGPPLPPDGALVGGAARVGDGNDIAGLRVPAEPVVLRDPGAPARADPPAAWTSLAASVLCFRLLHDETSLVA